MKIFQYLILCLLLSCNSKHKELPVLSYKIDASGHETYYTIDYKDFTNQLGNAFSSENIKDKIFIATFFFTRCPSICPPMRTQLIDIANTFANEDEFLIISHTIDPINDTILALKSYADATKISSDTWQFLRASEEHTKLQAEHYMTNFKPNEDGTDFYHSSYVALVDKDKFIRGFYNILVAEDVQRLKEDIRILLCFFVNNNQFYNSIPLFVKRIPYN
jgi:protein SCO1/2